MALVVVGGGILVARRALGIAPPRGYAMVMKQELPMSTLRAT